MQLTIQTLLSGKPEGGTNEAGVSKLAEEGGDGSTFFELLGSDEGEAESEKAVAANVDEPESGLIDNDPLGSQPMPVNTPDQVEADVAIGQFTLGSENKDAVLPLQGPSPVSENKSDEIVEFVETKGAPFAGPATGTIGVLQARELSSTQLVPKTTVDMPRVETTVSEIDATANSNVRTTVQPLVASELSTEGGDLKLKGQAVIGSDGVVQGSGDNLTPGGDTKPKTVNDVITGPGALIRPSLSSGDDTSKVVGEDDTAAKTSTNGLEYGTRDRKPADLQLLQPSNSMPVQAKLAPANPQMQEAGHKGQDEMGPRAFRDVDREVGKDAVSLAPFSSKKRNPTVGLSVQTPPGAAFAAAAPPQSESVRLRETSLGSSEVGLNGTLGNLEGKTGQITTERVRTEPVSARSIVNQVAYAVSKAPGENVIEIRLQPEELGRVRLSMTPVEGGVSVQVVAERSETLDLLRRNIDLLESDLQDGGFTGLEFTFGGEASGGEEEKNRSGTEDPSVEQGHTIQKLGIELMQDTKNITIGRLDIRV